MQSTRVTPKRLMSAPAALAVALAVTVVVGLLWGALTNFAVAEAMAYTFLLAGGLMLVWGIATIMATDEVAMLPGTTTGGIGRSGMAATGEPARTEERRGVHTWIWLFLGAAVFLGIAAVLFQF